MIDTDASMSARITAVSAFFLKAPVARSFSASAVRGSHTHRTAVLVRVDAGGTSGWGETFPALGSPSEPILEHVRTVLAPALLGGEALAVRDLNLTMRRASRGMGTGAIRGISAIDVALWDLRGRLLGQPVCGLLGARPGASFPAVATAVFYPAEADDPAPRVDEARGHAAAGFRGVKVKVGGLSPERDLAHVEAIRHALPDGVMLCTDANSGYPLRTALQMARGLAALGTYWFEEPIPIDDVEGYRALAAATGMWTAGGQDLPSSQAFLPLLEARALHIVQPSVAAVGGISEAVAAADQAARFGFRYCPTGWGTGLLVAASLHARAATASAVSLPAPDLDWIEFDVSDNPLRDAVLREPLLPARGLFTVPGGPGLGVEVDTERIGPLTEAAFTVRP
ncbi:MAG: mandelate racemase/muconate lactonizing enzyme family protein [Armatimonadota bacterium]|nr:mandelate racemase/muconate lactonizing enzyme family protein [Armatimonadota bacterium]MDR7422219.1 mandelate racemase/muconate lactonizing enzyme family protein [Armatimonadota bacterium]MDR7457961.1 mandelate racemase/muconate lactonizing enzyme family protein [Armatimonadota bacterium]MDR7495758.1 mandelate racemase/muconate lactonizing enzyme family protein [Armatimonadota bacterium]